MRHDRFIGALNDLAGRQDRIVTRAELLALGMSDNVIRGLRAREIITSVYPGTYIVGTPRLTHREFLRGSVKHAGPAAYPTHRSGLELRDLLDVRSGLATVTTLRRNVETPATTTVPLFDGGHGVLTIHQSTHGLDVEEIDGFLTTLLPRTFVDAARFETQAALKWAWRGAQFRAVLDRDAVIEQLRAHRRKGNVKLRKRLAKAPIVTEPGMDLRSKEGELLFLEICAEAGLPLPEVNVPMEIGGRPYVADFLFRFLCLIVETDGSQHDEPEHQEDDRVRDFEFFVAGFDVLRLSNARMREERQWCVDRLLAAVERQQRRAA